jgi:hypothetical protein
LTIFRGVGGGGNSTTDSEITLLTSLAAEASAAATLAGLSSAASGVSAGNAATSAGTATTQASNAASSASTASTQAGLATTNGAAQVTLATTQATNSATSATNAASSASTASTQATAASNSATSASTSASTATTQAGNASTSASGASTSASNAATSASTASTQASNAASSASGASTSATNAGNSATAASGSASTASTQASNASSSASAAATSASNASTSATNAANSAASVPADATLVHKTGNETIAGIKTFSSAPSLAGATLAGTVAGGGNQINNVVIGATTPLAGSFTTLNMSGDITVTGSSNANIKIQAANGATAGVRYNNAANTPHWNIFETFGGSGALGAQGPLGIYDEVAGVVRASFSSTGLAVTGALSCTGALSKGSGSFRINHPLPNLTEKHQLVHSFIEGPQADLIYRGRVELVSGKATVNIDTSAGMTEGTFIALCRDVQCFTSNESGWNHVRGVVVGNVLTIDCQSATATDIISWMVVGERQDKHMYETDWTDDNGKVIVEPLKPVPTPLEAK